MMLRENNWTVIFQLVPKRRLEPDFILHPNRHRFAKGRQAARRAGEIGGEQPVEFQKRVFIERDEIELTRADETGLAHAIVDRVARKSGVVLSPRESLFLRC